MGQPTAAAIALAALAGAPPAATVQNRLAAGLGPELDADAAERARWVATVAPLARQGKARASAARGVSPDDAEALRLASAQVRCPRLRGAMARALEAVSGEDGGAGASGDPADEALGWLQRSPLLAPVLDDMATRVRLGGTEPAPQVEGFAEQGADLSISRHAPDGRFYRHELAAEAEDPQLAVGDALLPLADLAAGRPGENLAELHDAVAGSVTGEAAGGGRRERLAALADSLPLDEWFAGLLPRLDDLPGWVETASLGELAEAVAVAEGMLSPLWPEGPPWPVVVLMAATLKVALPLLVATAAAVGASGAGALPGGRES